MRLRNEQRGTERSIVVKSAKVFDVRGKRYLPAETLNASDGGLLLVVRGGQLEEGAAIEVAVDWQAKGFMRRDQMQAARVVRYEGCYQNQFVTAVAYDKSIALPIAA